MGFLYQAFEKDVGAGSDASPSHADSKGPISDAERYRWIRAHRGDFAITRALECSDFDPDFDRQIDAAIHSARMAGNHPLATAWWDATSRPQRRRDDE